MGVQDLPFLCDSCLPAGRQQEGGTSLTRKWRGENMPWCQRVDTEGLQQPVHPLCGRSSVFPASSWGLRVLLCITPLLLIFPSSDVI